MAFSPGDTYEPVEQNPLYALVSKDLPKRIAAVRAPVPLAGTEEITEEQAAFIESKEKANDKWQQFTAYSDPQRIPLNGIDSVSDLRVAPLVASTWSQSDVAGKACYNYYTPPNDANDLANYVCGCVATAMAQVMR